MKLYHLEPKELQKYQSNTKTFSYFQYNDQINENAFKYIQNHATVHEMRYANNPHVLTSHFNYTIIANLATVHFTQSPTTVLLSRLL